MSEAGAETNGNDMTAGTQPRMQVMGQYVKDLSFENPGAPNALSARPAVEFGVDLQAKRLDELHYEVELKMRANATVDAKPVFLLELVYGGVFRLENLPEEMIQQVLLVEAPHILFPFARRIIADVVRDGGMPPMLVEPIDFGALYRAKMAENQVRQPGSPAPN
jgi:preprotein translocase subunit SecB